MEGIGYGQPSLNFIPAQYRLPSFSVIASAPCSPRAASKKKMKRKGFTHSFLVVKKKKIDDEKSGLAELLLLYTNQAVM